MEWERRNTLLNFTPEVISELLLPYLGINTPVDVFIIERGKLNTNYRIKIKKDNRQYFLRIHEGGSSFLKKEYWLNNKIIKKISTPEYYYVDCSVNNVINKPFALIEWIEGKHLNLGTISDDSNTQIKAKNIGQMLASLRSFSFENEGFFNEDFTVQKSSLKRSTQYLNFLENKLFSPLVSNRLGFNLRDQLWSFVNRYSFFIEAQESTGYLIHGDFNLQNIIFKEISLNASHCYLIDFEFSFSGSQLFDIGNFFRYDDKLPALFKMKFIEGYLESGGSLPENWFFIAKLLDLLSLCDLLSVNGNFKNLFFDVKKRIQRTLSIEEEMLRGKY